MLKFSAIVFTILLNTAKAQSNVTRGSSLTPTGVNTSWSSPSGLFAFGFYPQSGGYAVCIYMAGMAERNVVWTANRDALPLSNNATLSFTSDGRLSVEETPGKRIYISDSAGASLGSMQDSGNFVLYDSQGTILWQSFNNPTDTLLSGQRLVADQALFSSVSETDQSIGIFNLKMQSDGNLVQYPNVGIPDRSDRAYWSSGTYGQGDNVTLNLDSDGLLYLRNSTSFIKNLTQGGYPRQRAIYRMKLDVDGIFQVYYHDLSNNNGSVVIWASSSDKCTGRGLCGVNGYCFVMDDAAGCKCLPGFQFVNPELRSLGCRRNYTLNSCKDLDAGMSLQMTKLKNAKWEDAPYAIPEASTQDDCSKACLNDCNCEVALFTGQECKLQKLPLNFMEVRASEPSIGLIKLYTSSFSNTSDLTPLIQVKKVQRVKYLVIGVSLISFAVLILVLSGVVVWRAHVWAYRKISEHVNNVELLEEVGPQAFTYAELEGMTDGFKEELGRGSFGIVYKGFIESSKKVVAVKKLKEELAQEGEREFQTEIKVIGRTHHRNVARLLGSCCEGPKRLLVYEYMKKGSLADILFEPKESKKPCWEERIRMALDVAHGILYLHEECETTIVHCDIKPHNILMDEYGCAKISDFGLAKLFQHDQSKTFTLIRGTRGYVAPEWYKKLPITVKVDVYSFGILLFEILFCRRSVDNSLPVEEAILEEWVYDCYEVDQVSKLVDDEDVDEKKLEQIIKIGLWCIQEDPALRPSMKKVVLMLEGTVKIPVPPNPASFLTLV